MKYWFFLTFATVSWGLNFHLAKLMLEDSTALEAGLWRYVFGVGVLLFFLWGDWPRWSAIQKQLGPLFLVGFIGLFGFNYLFFVGLSMTSAINAALIAGLNPATTLLLSRLILKTRITRAQVVGIALALVGVCFLILKGRISSIMRLDLNLGDALILMANIVFALHNVWVKQHGGRLNNRHFTFLTNLFCLLGFVFLLPVLEIGPVATYPRQYWVAAIGMGAVGTALAYYFWNRGIAHLGAPQAGIFMNLVPLSAALFALAFGEIIQFYHIVSGTVIIIGVVIMQLEGRNTARRVVE